MLCFKAPYTLANFCGIRLRSAQGSAGSSSESVDSSSESVDSTADSPVGM